MQASVFASAGIPKWKQGVCSAGQFLGGDDSSLGTSGKPQPLLLRSDSRQRSYSAIQLKLKSRRRLYSMTESWQVPSQVLHISRM